MARCRKCDGCKALYVSRDSASCELGFEIRRVDSKMTINGRPASLMTLFADPDCPKPRTHNAMVEFVLNRSRGNSECGSSVANSKRPAAK